MKFKLDRSFYTPKDATILRQTDDAIVYGSNNGKIAALAFRGKAQKPAWHYMFRTEEQRDAHIENWLRGIQATADFHQELKTKRQAEIAKAHIKPGDYFYTSWGYDQTNIDYLVVVSVSPSGKTVKCRMVNPIHVGESGTSDVLMPGTACGVTFQMKVSGKDSLCGSYPYCFGHSSLRMGYFSRTSIAETRCQTMAQFGH